MDKIENKIYLGDYNDAHAENEIEAKGIETIVNLSGATAEDIPREIVKNKNWYHIPIADGSGNKDSVLYTAIRVTKDALSMEEKVLVHCAMGASRSPAILAAAMALEKDTSYDEELEKLKDVRNIVNPEPSLESQVKKVMESV